MRKEQHMKTYPVTDPSTLEMKLFDTGLVVEVPLSEIYDIKGRRVREIADRPFDAGRHSVVWDGTDSRGNAACSGIYFYRFITPDKARTGKVTLLR